MVNNLDIINVIINFNKELYFVFSARNTNFGLRHDHLLLHIFIALLFKR